MQRGSIGLLRFLNLPARATSVGHVSAREILAEEIQPQPEPLLREVLLYLKFLIRQQEEAAWADVLPGREVEQEVLDLLDGK